MKTPFSYPQIVSDSDIPETLSSLIAASESSILLSVYLFACNWHLPGVFVHDLQKSLKDAAERGVSVRCVLNRFRKVGKQRSLNRCAARKLAASGCIVRMANPTYVLHDKFWIFDDTSLFLGSANASPPSKFPVSNVALAANDPNTIAQARSVFETRWKFSSAYVD